MTKLDKNYLSFALFRIVNGPSSQEHSKQQSNQEILTESTRKSVCYDQSDALAGICP